MTNESPEKLGRGPDAPTNVAPPQIIRTRDELAALDPDTVLFTWGNMRAQTWLHTFEDDLPAVVIATGEQIRAARQALKDTP